MSSYLFPEDFAWGAATAAYQIEGAATEDGRQPSVWDTFSATEGKVLHGETGAIACDHYHRYRDDVKLMAQLGIKHYRFSIAWPRVVPNGRGEVNAAGLDFYSHLVDELLAHGITPHATLYHWDTPQALDDAYGSWQSRDIAQDFADYATVVVSHLGDRITHWFTLNEISCFTHLSYSVGNDPAHAPGKQVQTIREIWQTSHHALLAHGLGCQAIRATSPGPCSVSWVDNFAVPIPLTESKADIEAAQAAFPRLWVNGGIVVPALTGSYSPWLIETLGDYGPDIQPGDLDIIAQPLDVFGFNIYSGQYVRASDDPPGYELVPLPPGYPRLNMPWLHITPDALYWGIRHIGDTLNCPDLPMVVTENGCAAQDVLTPAGEVLDCDRIFFMKEYLRAAHRAIDDGYPLKGYFAWSLMDNFEWAYGYDRRFGLTYIDYPSQRRIPKASFHWYAECIRQNRVV